MIKNKFAHGLLAGAALTFLSGPAFALDGKDMMSKLTAAYGQFGAGISYDDVETDGSTVTAKGVKLSSHNAGKPVDLPIGDVVFDDVEEANNGGYTVGTVKFQDIDATVDKTHITASDIAMEGLNIPAQPSTDGIVGLSLYKSAHTGPVSVEVDGRKVFSLDSSVANVNVGDDNDTIGFETRISGMHADLSDVKDPKAQETIDALGLQDVQGEITVKGSWEAKTGKVDVTEYSADLRDIGKLNFNLSFSGYTYAFMKALQETTAAAAANPDKDSANAAMGMAMMGLMQQLTFNGASIRFDDASITKRVLDYVGKQQGVNGDQLAQSIKGMLPILMAKLNMPDFQSQVSAAVNKFLDDPQNIEITAAPANPVGVPMIMGAAMGAPQTLPQVLGVNVTANQ